MQKLKVVVLKPMILAAFLSTGLVGCVTSSPSPTGKQVCVKQEAMVGSRMGRSTCKPVAEQKEESKKTATAQ